MKRCLGVEIGPLVSSAFVGAHYQRTSKRLTENDEYFLDVRDKRVIRVFPVEDHDVELEGARRNKRFVGAGTGAVVSRELPNALSHSLQPVAEPGGCRGCAAKPFLALAAKRDDT